MSLVVIINLILIAAMTEFQAAQADYGLGIAKHTWQGISENTFEAAEYVFFSIWLVELRFFCEFVLSLVSWLP